jgi:hypothetical protein
MVKGGVLFEVRTDFSSIIKTSVGFKGLKCIRYVAEYIRSVTVCILLHVDSAFNDCPFENYTQHKSVGEIAAIARRRRKVAFSSWTVKNDLMKNNKYL